MELHSSGQTELPEALLFGYPLQQQSQSETQALSTSLDKASVGRGVWKRLRGQGGQPEEQDAR